MRDFPLPAIGAFVMHDTQTLLCTYVKSIAPPTRITSNISDAARGMSPSTRRTLREENHDGEDCVQKLKFDGNFDHRQVHTDQKGVLLGLRETGSPESMNSAMTSAIDSTRLC